MVAKGHHFSGVQLAAVVDADTGLAMPDFRAEERTFQLITQLAGRSGRDAPGRVLVQTFQPDARPIVNAARHDVGRFLAEELDRRRALDYPRTRTSCASSSLVRAGAGRARARGAESGHHRRRAPRPGALLRLRGKHRAQLVAKTSSRETHRLPGRAPALGRRPAMRKAKLTAVVDVDPQSL